MGSLVVLEEKLALAACAYLAGLTDIASVY